MDFEPAGNLCKLDAAENFKPSTGGQLERAKRKGYLDDEGVRQANGNRRKRRKVSKKQKKKAQQAHDAQADQQADDGQQADDDGQQAAQDDDSDESLPVPGRDKLVKNDDGLVD